MEDERGVCESSGLSLTEDDNLLAKMDKFSRAE